MSNANIPVSVALSLAAAAICAASLPAQARWTVEARPLVEIASESKGPNTLFNRIAHVEQLGTGELLVVDGATRELRFFSADGRFLRKVGRHGAGPGEFRNIAGVVVDNGRIHVFDGSQARLTRMDLAGGSVTTMTVTDPPDSRRGIHSYSLGGFIDRRPVFLASGFPSRKSAPRRYSDSMPQYLYTADVKSATRIGEPAIMDAFFESDQNMGDIIFGRFSTSAVGGGRLFVTDGGRFSVRGYDVNGRLAATMARDLAPRRTTDADFEDYVSFRQQSGSKSSRSELRRLLSPIPRAEFKPWITGLLVDDRNNLWVEHWRVKLHDGSGTWSVFEASGKLVGEVTFPRGFQPSTIRVDVVAGVSYDSDGVEGVQLLRVRR